MERKKLILFVKSIFKSAVLKIRQKNKKTESRCCPDQQSRSHYRYRVSLKRRPFLMENIPYLHSDDYFSLAHSLYVYGVAIGFVF